MMTTAGAIGVLLALVATVAFLDLMAVLLVHAEERQREQLEREHRREAVAGLPAAAECVWSR
jgi:uncharacterized membrane protein YbaN (DUF454 family)